MPSLRKMFAQPRRAKPQTWQEQLAVLKLWTAALGGKVITKPRKD
jgi:hypothetical protein